MNRYIYWVIATPLLVVLLMWYVSEMLSFLSMDSDTGVVIAWLMASFLIFISLLIVQYIQKKNQNKE